MILPTPSSNLSGTWEPKKRFTIVELQASVVEVLVILGNDLLDHFILTNQIEIKHTGPTLDTGNLKVTDASVMVDLEADLSHNILQAILTFVLSIRIKEDTRKDAVVFETNRALEVVDIKVEATVAVDEVTVQTMVNNMVGEDKIHSKVVIKDTTSVKNHLKIPPEMFSMETAKKIKIKTMVPIKNQTLLTSTSLTLFNIYTIKTLL